ncbi:ComEA family DNA-binding protein [Spiribacter onubensis]|uniref:Helix-hairpin-helix domain-containing protein n=1 Tax=Spiribacter onubensis TaxID=3122420 RepID=A0ABV3S8X2_9GAMM
MKSLTPLGGLLGLGLYAGVALATAEPVNVNEADIDQLQRINGIGPATAEAIVEDRELNGPFETIETMTRVNGIGEATLEAMREQVTLD